MAIHIYPINDSKEHEMESICECQPHVTSENGELIIIHNAFDGRQIIEQVNELLNQNYMQKEQPEQTDKNQAIDEGSIIENPLLKPVNIPPLKFGKSIESPKEPEQPAKVVYSGVDNEHYQIMLNIWYKPAKFRIAIPIDVNKASDIHNEIRKLDQDIKETDDFKIWVVAEHSIGNKIIRNNEKLHEQYQDEKDVVAKSQEAGTVKITEQPANARVSYLPMPSIGRIVHYRMRPVDKNYLYKQGQAHNDRDVLPAIIVAVCSDTCVNLKVFIDGITQDLWVTSSIYGEQEGQWQWPPRV